jgi:hypothetical protein
MRPALGANRLLQPGRDQGRRGAAGLLRPAERRPQRLGGVPRRLPRRPPGAARLLQRVLQRARSAAAAGRRLHPREPVAEPLPLSRRGRLPPRPPARAYLAQPADQRAHDRPGLGAAGGAARPGGAAGLPQPRLARLGRRRADAEADRRAGGGALPGRRLDGSSGTSTTTRSGSRRPASAPASTPTATAARS